MLLPSGFSWLCVGFMYGGRGNDRGDSRHLTDRSFQFRLPPGWGPEDEERYPFRQWCTEIRLWSCLTDLKPEQQAAAIILRLTGAARESTRLITEHEIRYGGIIRGRQYDPVGYILAGLSARYAKLGDETRLAAMVQFQCFQRLPGERINSFLDRFERVRWRAEAEGNFVQSVEASALQLMRCMNLSAQQFMQYTQPFGGKLPHTDDEFREMQSHMRRIGHIMEHSPDNIGQSLFRPQQRQNAYWQTARDAFKTGNTQFQENFMSSPGYTQSNHNVSPAEFQGIQEGETSWNGFISEDMTSYPAVSQVPGYADGLDYSFPTDRQSPDGQDGDMPFSETTTESMSSDTSTDSGDEDCDPDNVFATKVSDLAPDDLAKVLWSRFRKSRRTWRRFTGKPSRRFRRTFRKFKRRSWRFSGRQNKPGYYFRKDFRKSGGKRRTKKFGKAFYEAMDQEPEWQKAQKDVQEKFFQRRHRKFGKGSGFGRKRQFQNNP